MWGEGGGEGDSSGVEMEDTCRLNCFTRGNNTQNTTGMAILAIVKVRTKSINSLSTSISSGVFIKGTTKMVINATIIKDRGYIKANSVHRERVGITEITNLFLNCLS